MITVFLSRALIKFILPLSLFKILKFCVCYLYQNPQFNGFKMMMICLCHQTFFVVLPILQLYLLFFQITYSLKYNISFYRADFIIIYQITFVYLCFLLELILFYFTIRSINCQFLQQFSLSIFSFFLVFNVIWILN